MFYEHLKGPMEAMLFAAGDPLKAERLSELLDIPMEHVLEMLADGDRVEGGKVFDKDGKEVPIIAAKPAHGH